MEFDSQIEPLSPLFNYEYREPGGGYRFVFMGKEHATKWNSEIFMDGTAVTKGEFVERVIGMGFAPPLGVPSMAAINEMSIIIVGIANATEAKE